MIKYYPQLFSRLQKNLMSLSFLGSLAVIILFVYNNSIDLLMSDRAGVWGHILAGDSLWEGFHSQHGPHRLGLQYLLSNLGYFTGHGFNTQADLYVNAILIWTLAPAGLWLKWRVTNSFSWELTAK